MNSTAQSELPTYIVSVGTDQTKWFLATLEDIKHVVKLPASKRSSYVMSLPETDSSVPDLWIDASIDPIDFWDTEGNDEWRDFLIQENK